MKRVKPSFGSTAMSPKASGAIAVMCRARSSKPATSPGHWATGRPICQAISSAISALLATKASTAALKSARRSASGVWRQAGWAARARASASAISASLASGRST